MATVVERERERDTRVKLRQKGHADRTRGAKHSDIEEGDKVLLKQTRENKFSPNYEPEPYIVTCKDGNAVILRDTNGNNKMRNIAHMKMFVDPGTVDKGEIDPQPHLAEQPVQQNRISRISALVNQQQIPQKLHLAPYLQFLCTLCVPGPRPPGCEILHAQGSKLFRRK